jgi:hypothetical protein
MQNAGDPNVPLLVKSYRPRFFRVSAAVKIEPDYIPEKVLSAIEQILREQFSFAARSFGQTVNLSEVISVMQAVAGVLAIDVNEFYRADEDVGRHPRLPAAVPQAGDAEITSAEILILDPRPLGLEVLK